MKLIFDSPAKNVLREGGDEIHGGAEFTVSEDRGDELLAQANVPVRLVSSPAAIKRDALNELGKAAGVPDPEALPNKTAVVEAINHESTDAPQTSAASEPQRGK